MTRVEQSGMVVRSAVAGWSADRLRALVPQLRVSASNGRAAAAQRKRAERVIRESLPAVAPFGMSPAFVLDQIENVLSEREEN